MVIEEIASRIWPDGVTAVEPLGGGITNHNFKVEVGGETVVVRIGGKDTELLGIDRRSEHDATLAAAAVGVGPEIVAFVEPEGYLVTRFIAGRQIPPATMRRPENLGRVASALGRFHAGRAIPGRFDSHRVVETYRATAEAHGVAIPAAYAPAHERSREIEAVRGLQPLRPCHNDLLNANFIDDGERIRLVDWEYAGMGDVVFDLANFSSNHELEPADDELLVTEYYGALQPLDLAALRLMRFMSDFREAMWGVVQQGISQLDFDFVAYAEEHFERVARTAASAEFRAAFETHRRRG